jgi:nucleoside-diphosphate-sugar epimerase
MAIILITGINGLVGSAMARYLLTEGHQIRGLIRPQSDRSLLNDIQSQIEWYEGDVLDILSLEEALRGCTYVIHTAAVVSFVPRDRPQMYKTNVEGTANVVNVALNAGIQKIAFVSSVAALGRPDNAKTTLENPLKIDENQKWEESAHNSHYAKTKYLAEMEVWRGVAEGLPAVVVHPSIILGEGHWHRSSTQLFKYVADGKKYYTEGTVNYVDVQDVAEMTVKLLLSDIKNERFILSAGHTTYKILFEKIAHYMGKQPPTKAVAPWMIAILWRIEALRSWLTGSKPLITKETAHTSQTHFVYDNHKIKTTLGREFRGIDDTLRRALSKK